MGRYYVTVASTCTDAHTSHRLDAGPGHHADDGRSLGHDLRRGAPARRQRPAMDQGQRAACGRVPDALDHAPLRADVPPARGRVTRAVVAEAARRGRPDEVSHHAWPADRG